MKIFVDNVDSFMGSNLANYFIQHTDADIVGVVRTAGPYGDVEPSVRSRSRFQMQFVGVSEDCLAMRFAYESPDFYISTGRVPSFLENDRTVIAVSSQPVDCGVRNLLIPRAFGPRQRVDAGVARLIWATLHNSDIAADTNANSTVYIKDVFDELLKFMLSDARFRAVGGTPVTDRQVLDFVRLELGGSTDTQQCVPAELAQALRHTARWYSANRWVADLT